MKYRFLRVLFAVLVILMAIYPMIYINLENNSGFLSSKLQQVLVNPIWMGSFYFHIVFGSISLLTGWPQFLPKLRSRYLKFHRKLGIVYLGSVSIGGFCGLYMAFYANGGLVSVFGFIALAVCWLFTTWKAFLHIRKNQIVLHQAWMMRSYALTFAAVTLRIWLPALSGFGLEFITAYKIISWLSWVPNLLVAEWLINRTRAKPGYIEFKASKQ